MRIWLATLLITLAQRVAGPTVTISAGVGARTRPVQVRIVLDRPRTLRLTMAESAAFRKRTKISIWRSGVDLGDLEEEQLAELLAVCAHADDPTVTPEQLAPHLEGEKLLEAVAALAVLVGSFTTAPTASATAPLLQAALLRLGAARG